MNFDHLEDIDIDQHFFNNNYPSLTGNNSNQYFNIDTFCENFPAVGHEKDLNIFHINIRSIGTNGNDLITYLSNLGRTFHIICLTETWILNDFSIFSELFPCYRAVHSVRSTSRPSGGASILIHKDIEIIDNDTLSLLKCNDENIELVFAEICINNRHIRIGSCYRPPSGNFDVFLDALQAKLDVVQLNSCDFFLCGDYNIDLLKVHEDCKASKFIDTLNALSLLPVIVKPTRVTETSATIIDNIFTNKLYDISSGILEIQISEIDSKF